MEQLILSPRAARWQESASSISPSGCRVRTGRRFSPISVPTSIKVERLQALTPDGRPDERYGSRFLYGKDPEDSRFYTAGFLAANRNKRSIGLDLKSAEGVAVARRLVGISDVVYENFRPGVTERLGLGYEDCRAINPSVIYASASGYGQSGPYVDLPGQDILTQAIGGWGAMNADHTGRPGPGRHVDHRRAGWG